MVRRLAARHAEPHSHAPRHLANCNTEDIYEADRFIHYNIARRGGRRGVDFRDWSKVPIRVRERVGQQLG